MVSEVGRGEDFLFPPKWVQPVQDIEYWVQPVQDIEYWFQPVQDTEYWVQPVRPNMKRLNKKKKKKKKKNRAFGARHKSFNLRSRSSGRLRCSSRNLNVSSALRGEKKERGADVFVVAKEKKLEVKNEGYPNRRWWIADPESH